MINVRIDNTESFPYEMDFDYEIDTPGASQEARNNQLKFLNWQQNYSLIRVGRSGETNWR